MAKAELKVSEERAKEIQLEKDKSQMRMAGLTKNIFDTIKKTHEEFDGCFTYVEMNEVFIRVQHAYNGKALASQFVKK